MGGLPERSGRSRKGRKWQRPRQREARERALNRRRFRLDPTSRRARRRTTHPLRRSRFARRPHPWRRAGRASPRRPRPTSRHRRRAVFHASTRVNNRWRQRRPPRDHQVHTLRSRLHACRAWRHPNRQLTSPQKSALACRHGRVRKCHALHRSPEEHRPGLLHCPSRWIARTGARSPTHSSGS